MVFTVKANYGDELRRISFPDANTFPSFGQISNQLYRVFPISNHFYLSKVLFSPDASKPSSRILLSREIASAEQFAQSIFGFINRTWPNAMLRFTVLDKAPHKIPSSASQLSAQSAESTPRGGFAAPDTGAGLQLNSPPFISPPPPVILSSPAPSSSIHSEVPGIPYCDPANPLRSGQRMSLMSQSTAAPSCGRQNPHQEIESLISQLKMDITRIINKDTASNCSCPRSDHSADHIYRMSPPTNVSNGSRCTFIPPPAPPTCLLKSCSLCSTRFQGPWFSCTRCHTVICPDCSPLASNRYCFATGGHHIMQKEYCAVCSPFTPRFGPVPSLTGPPNAGLYAPLHSIPPPPMVPPIPQSSFSGPTWQGLSPSAWPAPPQPVPQSLPRFTPSNPWITPGAMPVPPPLSHFIPPPPGAAYAPLSTSPRNESHNVIPFTWNDTTETSSSAPATPPALQHPVLIHPGSPASSAPSSAVMPARTPSLIESPPASPEPVAGTPSPVVHRNVICDHCETEIRGVRRKCLDCPDYDLCSGCFTDGAASRHNPFHEFFDIEEPGRVIVHTVFSGEGERETTENTRGSARAAPAENQEQRRNEEVHYATCDLCDSRIIGDRFKCQSCPDFDTCSSCFSIVPEQHPNHAFVKVRCQDDYIRFTEKEPKRHYATCNVCGSVIAGTRYKCTQCYDFDLCHNCEAHPIDLHPETHVLLKIKSPDAVIPPVGADEHEPQETVAPIASPVLRAPSTTAYDDGYINNPSDNDDLYCSYEPSVAGDSRSSSPIMSIPGGLPVLNRQVIEERIQSPEAPDTPNLRPSSPPQLPPVPTVDDSFLYEYPVSTKLRPVIVSDEPQYSYHPRTSSEDRVREEYLDKPTMTNLFCGTSLNGIEQNSPPSPESVPNFPVLVPQSRTQRSFEPVDKPALHARMLPTPPSNPPGTDAPFGFLSAKRPVVQWKSSIESVPNYHPADPFIAEVEARHAIWEEAAVQESPLTNEALLSRPSRLSWSDMEASEEVVRPKEERPIPERPVSFVNNRSLAALLNAPAPSGDVSPVEAASEPVALPPIAFHNKDDGPFFADFVKDVTVAEGQVFPPGAEFIKIWRLRNCGPRAWPSDVKLVFVAGTQLGTRETSLPLVGNVLPGEEIEVSSGEMKAPETPGRYVGYWRLRDNNGVLFGQSIWIDITVKETSAPSSEKGDSLTSSSIIVMPGGAATSPLAAHVSAKASSIDTEDVVTISDGMSNGSSISLVSAPESDGEGWNEIRQADERPIGRRNAIDYVVLYEDSSDEDSD